MAPTLLYVKSVLHNYTIIIISLKFKVILWLVPFTNVETEAQ
jgi:hypothetical protein